MYNKVSQDNQKQNLASDGLSHLNLGVCGRNNDRTQQFMTPDLFSAIGLYSECQNQLLDHLLKGKMVQFRHWSD